MFDEKDELLYGDINKRAKDASDLIAYCAAQGEYVNTCSPEKIITAAKEYGCALLAYYDGNKIASCAVMTDKDFYQSGLETKKFLCDKISQKENKEKKNNKEFNPETTRIIWVSSVATHPDYRGRGLARILFAHNEAYAMSQASKYEHIIVACAVRKVNEHMLSFMEHVGYKDLDENFNETNFGLEADKNSLDWRILYRVLK